MTMSFAHAPYQAGMEVIASDIGGQILARLADYQPEATTEADVARALAADRLDVGDFGALLSPAARPFLEAMAAMGVSKTRRYLMYLAVRAFGGKAYG